MVNFCHSSKPKANGSSKKKSPEFDDQQQINSSRNDKPDFNSDRIVKDPFENMNFQNYNVDEELTIVCISDTHTNHHKMLIPNGDIQLHAGDFTLRGFPDEVENFNNWLKTLPHKHKIVIAGNHELTFDLSEESKLKKLFTVNKT